MINLNTILSESDDNAPTERSNQWSETDEMWLQIDPTMYARIERKDW